MYLAKISHAYATIVALEKLYSLWAADPYQNIYLLIGPHA